MPTFPRWRCPLPPPSLRLPFLLAALLGTTPAHALDPARALTQYSLTSWQSEQGLPQNTVTSIAQTRDGYLWLGTIEGLVRFDGARLTVFDRTNVPGLSRHHITSLHVDPAGALWAGTDGSGLLVRDEAGGFRRLTSADGLPDDVVLSVASDAEGRIWAGTTSGLARLERTSSGLRVAVFTKRHGLALDRVTTVAVDPSGAAWAGTDAGVCRVTLDSVRCLGEAEGLPNLHTRQVLVEADGSVWVVPDSGGVCQLRDGVFRCLTEANGLPSSSGRTLLRDRAGSLWVGFNGGGLARVVGGRVEALGPSQGLSNDSVFSLLEDRDGSLWVGTLGGGLNRLREGAVTPLGPPEGLSQPAARAVLEDGDGTIWVGTETGGLNRIRGREVKVFRKADGLPDDRVYGLWASPRGLWVGTVGGRLSLLREGSFHREPAWDIGDIHTLLEDRGGTLWIGTFRDGLGRLSPDGTLSRITTREGLPSDRVLSLAEAPDGSIWVGMGGGGVARVAGGRVARVGPAPGLPGGDVFGLLASADGTLWMGTAAGLGRVKDGRFATLGRAQGLVDDVLYGLVEDGSGGLFMTCNRGIFRVPKDELDAVAEGRARTVKSVVLGTADGMRSPECNSGGQPAFRARDGRLLFPTIRGVAIVDPKRVAVAGLRPRIVLEELLVDDAPLKPGPGGLDVAAGASRIEVRFSAPSPSAPERLRFRYRLEPIEASFIETGDRRVAYFSHLRPGSYVLHLAASVDGDPAAVSEVRLPMRLRPRFWQTTWFAALTVFGTALLVAGAVRLRIARLEARQRELTDLVAERTREVSEALALEAEARRDAEAQRADAVAQRAEAEEHRAEAERQRERAEEANRAKSAFLANMSHELRTPLNAIIGYAEMLHEEVSGQAGGESVASDLTKIRTAGKHLLGLINDILDLSKIEAGKMQLNLERFEVAPLLGDLVETVQPLVQQKGNRLIVEGANGLGAMHADPVRLRQILLNLLSNASKFTERGTITLTASRESGAEREWLGFVVADSGIGMSPEQMARLFQPFAQADASTSRRFGGTGLGLAISRRFCQMMGGTLTLESEEGKGSRFTVRLPVVVGGPSRTSGAMGRVSREKAEAPPEADSAS